MPTVDDASANQAAPEGGRRHRTVKARARRSGAAARAAGDSSGPPPAAEPPAGRPLFGSFLDQARAGRRTGWVRRATIVGSIAVHAGALLVGVAYSFWKVEELRPPQVSVTFLSLPVAPPPPPPPARAAARAPKPRPRPLDPVMQPVTTAPVQPPAPDEGEAAEETQAGEAGGVTGGVVGAALTEAPPPRPPELSAHERQLLIRRYLEEVVRPRIAARLRLPPEAERLGVEGTVLMTLAVDTGGRLIGLRTAGSCPHEILCEAAARTIRESAPFPPPPAALVGGLQAELPLTYRLE